MNPSHPVSDLIRAARKGLTQKEFAALLGVKQSSVSRYERGKVNPPAKVIGHCMHVANKSRGDDAPTSEQLAEQVRIAFAAPHLAPARALLARVISAMALTNEPSHVKRGTHE